MCISRFQRNFLSSTALKRGLRNDDGTGVMAGLTSVGAVLGHYIDDGEKSLWKVI